LFCAFRVAGAVVVGRGGAVIVVAGRDGAGLVAQERGGRWDPVVILGCTYLTEGCGRWILMTGLGAVMARAGPDGRANCAAFEK
jgi:hypothetical protein